MIHVTCRLPAKNRNQLRNPTLGNRASATFFLQHRQTKVDYCGAAWITLEKCPTNKTPRQQWKIFQWDETGGKQFVDYNVSVSLSFCGPVAVGDALLVCHRLPGAGLKPARIKTRRRVIESSARDQRVKFSSRVRRRSPLKIACRRSNLRVRIRCDKLSLKHPQKCTAHAGYCR